MKDRFSFYENPKSSQNSFIAPSKDENRQKRNQSLRWPSGKRRAGSPGTIAEDKNIPAGEFPSQFIFNQTTQTIERLAHIAQTRIKVLAAEGAQGKH